MPTIKEELKKLAKERQLIRMKDGRDTYYGMVLKVEEDFIVFDGITIYYPSKLRYRYSEPREWKILISNIIALRALSKTSDSFIAYVAAKEKQQKQKVKKERT